jgi:hypothetical protein
VGVERAAQVRRTAPLRTHDEEVPVVAAAHEDTRRATW